MTYYSLAQWTTEADDTVRPNLDADEWAVIDFRPDSTSLAGWCLVASTNLPTGGVFLGEALDEPSIQLRNGVRSRLGVEVEATTLRGMVAELLILWGEADIPTRTRWKRLVANRFGRHKIVMLRETLYDAPVVQGAVITDDFNRADADPISNAAAGWSWSEFGGADYRIHSNRAKQYAGGASGTERLAKANSDLDANHYAQVTVVSNIVNTSRRAGVLVRGSSGDEECYLINAFDNDEFRIERQGAGGTTSFLASAVITVAWPADVRGEADGSNLYGYWNGAGTPTVSTTDTTYPSNLRTGLISLISSGDQTSGFFTEFDDFEAGDLVAEDPANVVAIKARTLLPWGGG